MISDIFKMANVFYSSEITIMMMFCFSVFCLFVSSALADNVPVLMWSPSRPLSDLPQPFVGNTVDQTTFHQSYLSPLSSTNGNHIVVFLQDKLNINDFAKYADIYNPYSDGGAFKHIKGFMEDNFSVHLPSVKTPMSAIEELKKNFQGRQHVIKSSADISNLKLDDGKSYLILVMLPNTNGAGNEEKALSNNDGVVRDIVKELKKRSIKYTGLYTAESSQSKPSLSGHTGRRLLEEQTERNDSIFINVTDGNSAMYFYARSIKLYIIDPATGMNFNLTMPVDDDLRDDNASAIANSTGQFAVEFKSVSPTNGTDKYDFSFKFQVTKNQEQRMKITNFTVSLKNISDASSYIYKDEYMDVASQDLDLPAMFSYHCSAFSIKQQNITEANKLKPYVKLSFDGFQFQAFTIRNDEFGHSWDCVPFFTTAIWMALFYGVIFLSILYYGMYMIFQLSTMDRFDDPKGKTITVNAQE